MLFAGVRARKTVADAEVGISVPKSTKKWIGLWVATKVSWAPADFSQTLKKLGENVCFSFIGFIINYSGVCNKTPPSQTTSKDGNKIFLFPEQQIETEADPDDDEEDEVNMNKEVDEAKEMEKVKGYQSDLRKFL